MAKPSSAASPASIGQAASAASDPTDLRLRALKNRLQARFPDVRSSHLTEAIAAGLGFNTHAALLAAKAEPFHSLAIRPFQAKPFKQRLVDLSYPVQPDFRFGPQPEGPKPSAKYLEWLDELKRLEKTPDRVWPRIHALRRECADEFARTFGLGHLEDEDDKSVVKRWTIGVDHNYCLPGWGDNFNAQRGAHVDFPGSDHRWKFFEALPLASSSKPKSVEYASAMVSMPYLQRSGLQEDLVEAGHRAGRIGWTCSRHDAWSWYAPGATALVLFKRLTPAAEMRQAWSRSFKRWLLENRPRLAKSAKQLRRYVIDDAVDCQHLPLDLMDYEDCRERYLREFAFNLYLESDDVMPQNFEKLMTKWAEESREEALA